MDTFDCTCGFCPVCGSILPALKERGDVACYNCKKEFDPTVYGDEEVQFNVVFNIYDFGKSMAEKMKSEQAGADSGPLVERKCPKCGHDQMSYATLQLRSADEGQTVFFTCVNCKFKETENS